jgi:hypothetical protein
VHIGLYRFNADADQQPLECSVHQPRNATLEVTFEIGSVPAGTNDE